MADRSRRSLSLPELDDALAALVGERVSVRVVEPGDTERLHVVLEGVLRDPSSEKAPSRFWPLDDGLAPREAGAERFGIVLHADEFEGAESRAGGHVLVIRQGTVVINVRRL